MSEPRQERLRTAGWAVLGLLLLAGFAVLIWTLLQPRDAPQRYVLTTITHVQLPPPPPPAITPKKLIPRHVDSIALTAPVPKPQPLPPKPRMHRHIAAKPLAAEPSPTPNQYDIPQGTDQGIIIGGDGSDGGGIGCGGSSYYLTLVMSQLRTVLMNNEKTDSRTFHIKADVWFDGTGTLQRSRLAQSTGDARLDAKVRRLLGEVHVGEAVPSCLQPITLWVSEPWQNGTGGEQIDQTNARHFSAWWRQTPGPGVLPR